MIFKNQIIKREDRDYVVCQLCGLKKKFLATHVLRIHNMKIKEYKKLYPNKKNVCKEYSDKVTNIGEANGFYNKHHTEESKEKQRNSDYHKSLKGMSMIKRYGNKKAKEIIRKQRKTSIERYKNGVNKIWSTGLTKYTDERLAIAGISVSKAMALKANHRHPNSKWYKQGYYISKFGIKEFYHSSWELKIMKQLDNDDKVTFWTKKHKIILPYYKKNIEDKIPGITHDINSLGHYVSDFYVERTNQKYLIECKPKNFWNTTINQNKFMVGMNYCIKRDMIFMVCEDKILNWSILRNIKEPLNPELDFELRMDKLVA